MFGIIYALYFAFEVVHYFLKLFLLYMQKSYSLTSVPGGNEGPSGVLICSENYITYKNFGDQPDIRCPIPRRRVSANFF